MPDYESLAARYMQARHSAAIGASTVRNWARTIPPNAFVLDLGCGSGMPMTQVLVDAGFRVYAIDSSPSMLAAFRTRFPDVPTECARVEDSGFFHRQFDAALAWGLLFLLDPGQQRAVIGKVAVALRPGAQFLFTAPHQACSWNDAMTGQVSVSLGRDEYRKQLESAGLQLTDEFDDEGANHYYSAKKR